ncbi:hypothetical protein SAMN04487914_108106 [Arthrobacter sp. ok909]|nr:hypothetical protein SAMN04487914_108106 [Arthrobacter sp. ok909]
MKLHYMYRLIGMGLVVVIGKAWGLPFGWKLLLTAFLAWMVVTYLRWEEK